MALGWLWVLMDSGWLCNTGITHFDSFQYSQTHTHTCTVYRLNSQLVLAVLEIHTLSGHCKLSVMSHAFINVPLMSCWDPLPKSPTFMHPTWLFYHKWRESVVWQRGAHSGRGGGYKLSGKQRTTCRVPNRTFPIYSSIFVLAALNKRVHSTLPASAFNKQKKQQQPPDQSLVCTGVSVQPIPGKCLSSHRCKQSP